MRTSARRSDDAGQIRSRADVLCDVLADPGLLLDAGLHGHEYAVDAVVEEMALRQQRPVVLLASDVDDMAKLCGDRVPLVSV
jgi:hypothetical protein